MSNSPTPPPNPGFWPRTAAQWLPFITLLATMGAMALGIHAQGQANTAAITELKAQQAAAASKSELQQLDSRVQKLESTLYQISADLQYLRGRAEAGWKP